MQGTDCLPTRQPYSSGKEGVLWRNAEYLTPLIPKVKYWFPGFECKTNVISSLQRLTHKYQNLHTLQITASLASTLCSITSLIIGMSYLWQHRSRSDPGYLQIVSLRTRSTVVCCSQMESTHSTDTSTTDC